MPKSYSRIDAYIEKAARFARIILRKVRRLEHAALPKIEGRLSGTCLIVTKGTASGLAHGQTVD